MSDDVLLDNDGDLDFSNGDLIVGNSEMQEIGLILQSNQGDYKEDPIIGANLNRFIKGVQSNKGNRKQLAIALARDGKDFNRIKNKLQINGTIN